MVMSSRSDDRGAAPWFLITGHILLCKLAQLSWCPQLVVVVTIDLGQVCNRREHVLVSVMRLRYRTYRLRISD